MIEDFGASEGRKAHPSNTTHRKQSLQQTGFKRFNEQRGETKISILLGETSDSFAPSEFLDDGKVGEE